MNKRIPVLSTFIICLLLAAPVFSQEEEDKPIRPPFETTLLIDNQTTVNPYKGSLGLEIQHRFSEISSISDLFGLYGSANTRMALTYGITDKLSLAFGTTRSYSLQDLEWKYSIFTQTRSGKVPVSLSYVGNAVIDARESTAFGEGYKGVHRLSYMNQLIVSRKFGMRFSAQAAPTIVWLNAVPEGYNNFNMSVNTGFRAQVLGFHSIIAEFEQPLMVPDGADTYANIALGVEIGTSTHSFRVFVSNYNNIVKNYNVAYNTNNPLDGNFHAGFNISIKF